MWGYVWGVSSGLTDEIGHEEEDVLRVGLGCGEVHRGFCVYDFDG